MDLLPHINHELWIDYTLPIPVLDKPGPLHYHSPMRKTTYLLFSLALLLLGASWVLLSAPQVDVSAGGLASVARKGFLAPDFELQTLTGSSLRLSNLRGKVVILNLWASWCPPCKAEMPTLERIYQEYHSQGLEILAVNNTIQDSSAAAADFVQQNGLTFPVPLDVEGRVSQGYLLSALPTTFFIDSNGIIREVTVGGPLSEALLRIQVETLLKEVH